MILRKNIIIFETKYEFRRKLFFMVNTFCNQLTQTFAYYYVHTALVVDNKVFHAIINTHSCQ